MDPLLWHHPTFNRFAENLQHGIEYLLKKITDEDCIDILERSIARGNHKSELSDEERPQVTKVMTQDVNLGYGIPIKVECLKNVPGAEVYPVGVKNQLSKKRVTNDPYFNQREVQSVNQWVRHEELPRVIFGFSILRFLHLVHHLHWNHPNEQIMCKNIDVEKAY